MPKDPVFIQTGELADDEVRVYPSDRVEITDVDSQRLMVQVHYYPNEDAYLAGKPESMRFLFTTHGAEVVANHILRSLQTMRDDAKNRPIDPFRKN